MVVVVVVVVVVVAVVVVVVVVVAVVVVVVVVAVVVVVVVVVGRFRLLLRIEGCQYKEDTLEIQGKNTQASMPNLQSYRYPHLKGNESGCFV